MNIKSILLFYALGLLTACDNNMSNTTSEKVAKEKIEKGIMFDRLVGVWKNEDGKSYERWIKNADGSYLSEGFQVKDGDTVYAERVYVYQENSHWFSENTVPTQNEGKAVKFKVTQLSQDEVHFNNPAHDFPTDIHYHLTGKNTIYAFIAGPNLSGSRDTISFNFIRVVN